MIRTENWEVMGWDAALRGMRNPKESWDRGDTIMTLAWEPLIGANDLDLCCRLIKAGSDHRKFLRMIICTVDITAPLYWWKEFDTYKVGTVANSCSTMHRIHSSPITMDCFATDRMNVRGATAMQMFVSEIEHQRKLYLETGDKNTWETCIQMLPTSWLQKRTVQVSYETLLNMWNSRRNHKLAEWRELCSAFDTHVPYFKIFREAAYGPRRNENV